MTTEEFIKQVEALDYTVERIEKVLFVRSTKNRYTTCVLSVDIEQQYSLYTRNFSYGVICEEEREKLYNLAVEYDKTPVEERGKLKKYYIRLDVECIYKENMYLNKRHEELWFSSSVNDWDVETKFTDKEISEFPTWVNNMLRDGYLIKEEVEDDDF